MEKVLVYGMTSNPGGIESYLINLLKYAKENGVQLDFITDFPEIAYEKIIREYGGEIYYIPPKGKKLLAHWLCFYKILKKHREYKIIYFNVLNAGAAFTAVIPWVLKRKIVIHSHNGETDQKQLQRLSRPILNLMTDERIACSKVAAEFMFGTRSLKKNNILIVPNAIDIDKYEFKQQICKKVRDEMNLNGKLVICHIGRLTEQKNPLRLLEIFKTVLQKEKEAVLLSVGTGEMEKEVHDYAMKLEIQDSVRFLGKRDDVSELLQGSDVFVLPSKYEGLPIVAIEAQASGIPSVLSSTISKEVNISGRIKFLDLGESNEKWADEILKSAGDSRYECVETLKEEGYDSNKMSEQTRHLITIFKDKRNEEDNK